MRAYLVVFGLGVSLSLSAIKASAAPTTWMRLDKLVVTTSILDGAATLAPLPFLRFCRDYADQCGGEFTETHVETDPSFWAAMQAINLDVNRSIAPIDEGDNDRWQLGRTEGDCDDYAVEKRRRLIEMGVSPAALSLTEVITRGVGHLVLTVRTDRGAFVLDNLRSRIMPWRATGYQFVRMQSAKRPDYWVSIGGSVTPPIATIERAGLRLASMD